MARQIEGRAGSGLAGHVGGFTQRQNRYLCLPRRSHGTGNTSFGFFLGVSPHGHSFFYQETRVRQLLFQAVQNRDGVFRVAVTAP